MAGYVELQASSNFSFLRGASHPEELVDEAARLALAGIAITDRNTLAGAVRAHVAAKRAGVRLVIGCRIDLEEGESFLAYPRDRAAYGRLCRLLTRGKRAAPKGQCHLGLDDLAEHADGLCLIAIPPLRIDPGLVRRLASWRERLGSLWLAGCHLYRGDDAARLERLDAIARQAGIALVAVNDVHYHTPRRRALADVLTCIREKCTLAEAGFRLAANGERHLKAESEMRRLFKGHEAAVAQTLEIADACRFSLDELAYEYPDEPVPAGKSAQQHLVDLTWRGARARYPQGVPEKVATTLERELAIIARLGFAPYFLTVHDIVTFARSRGILCQGRGSAANSAVCYCLGITCVDPTRIDLLFERFVSEARNEPPDIDVDFEHERREEVIQYIYARYGRERAAIAATVITYRARSAIRDVAKVFALSGDVAGALAAVVWGRTWDRDKRWQRVREAGLDPADRRLRLVIAAVEALIGFPRHLSQHVGGFVLTRGPLEEVVPIGNAAMDGRTFIEWDKDDIDALGILKVDVLGLGMLTCIRKAFAMIAASHGRALSLASVPGEDPAVYDMLCRADSVGVFQVESRAQMNMLPRLKPRCFYDLVIEVAIVRPGPIQGDMVHPYLRRRDGAEAVEYPSPDPQHGPGDELRRVLEKTLGVPLFQEQAMRIAIEAAGFSPDEANELRRSMATFRRLGTIGRLEEKMVSRMVARGYEEDFARRCFEQIKGFGDYGFPESHAASFAALVYVSAWLKRHYPDAFCAALLNSQPMGFYAPAQIVRDAREHGVEVRPVDVNHSAWDATLEVRDGMAGAGLDHFGRFAVRLGFRLVNGLRKADGEAIVKARKAGRFASMEDVARRARLSCAMLERLAAADALKSLALSRRPALWSAAGLKEAAGEGLFAGTTRDEKASPPDLPAMTLGEEVVADYRSLRLSLKAHPMALLRPHFAGCGVIDNDTVRQSDDGARVKVAGIVIIRQRPGSANGVVFMTTEDETGVANIVIWPDVLERYRKVVMGARLILVEGRVQRHDDIIHVIACRLVDRSADLARLSADIGDPSRPLKPATAGPARHPRQVRVIPPSRDFR